MNLTDKKTNFEGVIQDLVGDEVYTKRLRELGFIRGEKILLKGVAPFGEPLMIEIRGTVVALRKREAECIQV